MNLPNFISLGRLMAVPVIVWLTLTHQMHAAFWLFAAAGISDILDGLLARLLKEHTAVGAFLDPLADKALLVGLFITLTIRGYIPLWLAILVVFRDCVIIGGSLILLLLQKKIKIEPLLISKINTLVQILLITFVLGCLAYRYPYCKETIEIVSYLVAFTTIVFGIGYVLLWIKTIDKVDK